MTEHEDVFDNADDAMSRLQDKFDNMSIAFDNLAEFNSKLIVRYKSVCDMLRVHLEDDKGRKIYLIDKYQKDNNDISTKLEGLKQTMLRDLDNKKLEE